MRIHLIAGIAVTSLCWGEVIVPQAGPDCSSLPTVAQQKAQPCITGQFEIKDVDFQANGKGARDASAFTLQFPSRSGVMRTELRGAFDSQAGDDFTYRFDFLIDPPPPILQDVDFVLESPFDGDSGTLGIFAQNPALDVDFYLCAGAPLNGLAGCQGFYASSRTNRANPRFSVRFPNPVNIIDVTTIIRIQNGASMSGITLQTVLLPEPATAGLTLGGLALILAVRRRTRQHAPAERR